MKKTDVLWFFIKRGTEEAYEEIAPGVNVELDKNGKVLGPKLGFKIPTRNISYAHKIKA